MDATTIAYLAGIIDGEGYIGILKQKPTKDNRYKTPHYYLRVEITMTDKEVIEWISTTFGFTMRSSTPLTKGYRKRYSVVLHSKKAIPVLKKIQPYCIVKKQHIELAIDFIENIPLLQHRGIIVPIEESQRREAIYNKIKSINYHSSIPKL